MKVHLAGYNVDTTVLGDMVQQGGKRPDLTPEVLSAAYARISRDPRPIDEIRQDARSEVERTRKSNSTIIFKMGHHSVAEHAVFNIDVVGLSRYAMEELEKFRLCSYTEKSQRYITLDKDYVIPEEIKGTDLESIYVDTVALQNKTYHTLYERLEKHVFEKHADLAKVKRNKSLLEGWAKEDARYVTALATESQVGLTTNARNLELMLRRFASHPLLEVQDLGKKLYEQIVEVAPSIVIFHQANDRDQKTYGDLATIAQDLLPTTEQTSEQQPAEVTLVEHTPNADTLIAAALLHAVSNQPYEECKKRAENLSPLEQENLFKASWRNMQLYDSMLREFEFVNLSYSISLSSACFGQLKRHRMATITAQPYNTTLGVTIPESIKEIGMEEEFLAVVQKSEEACATIAQSAPLVAPYLLTNAHRKRVLMRVNARELYHISRLREDAHAQWDIQNIARLMVAEAKKVMPQSLQLTGGKDRYKQVYQEVFHTLPKVVEVALPGARTIS